MVKYTLSLLLLLLIQFSKSFGFFPVPNIETNQSTIYEAENYFSVVTDVGSKGDIIEFPESIYADGTGKAVTLFDNGDRLKIAFEIESSGMIQLKINLRSGYNNAPESYWPNGYAFTLDGNSVNFVGDVNSISTFQSAFGGSYWGNMVLNGVELSAGNHELTIECKSSWGAVDYLEVIQEVIPNQKPQISPLSTQKRFISESVSLQVEAIDEENDSLVYVAMGLPEGLWINERTGLISGELEADRSNSLYPITISSTIKVYEAENPDNYVERELKWTLLVYETPPLAKYEVEDFYYVNQDFLGNGLITVFEDLLENGKVRKVVGFPDKNDQIHVNFSIPEDGTYVLNARVRSGDATDSQSFWHSGYSFFVDDVRLNFSGDNNSIFQVNDTFGESYWGDLKSPVLELKKGNYFLEVRADKAMGGIDFFEVEIAEGESGLLYQSQLLQGIPNSPNIYFAKWLDFDDDGDLDLMVVEEYSNQIKLYTNNQNNFTASLIPLPYNEEDQIISFEVRDFDSDGDFDFLLYSFLGYDTELRIIENQEGNYVEMIQSFDVYGVFNFKWIDVDQDGDLELSIGRYDIQTSYDFIVELNKADKTLFENNARNVRGVGSWADYNQDGLVDFLHHGYKYDNGVFNYWTKLLQQNSSGIFEDMNVGLPDQLYGEWFDYDGDGDLDIKAETYYENNGSGQFSDTGIPSPIYPNNTLNGLTNVIAKVDYNGDGFLDIFTKDGKLLINQSFQSKPLPIVPTNLNALVDSSSALLTWDNVRRPEEHESYNLYVKKGDELILSGEANFITGYGLVEESNVGIHPIFKVTNLKPGTYQWSVQTKGCGKLSSKFAAEGTFVIENSVIEPASQKYEAEEHFIVINNQGSKSNVTEFSSPVYSDDSGRAVAIFDNGDEFKIDFDVPSSGNYTLKLRVRSGHTHNSMVYWPNGYLFKLDNNSISLNGDPGSVSDFSSHFGGAYWGDMISEPIQISEGKHSLFIKANSSWGAVDYLIVESEVHQSAASRNAYGSLDKVLDKVLDKEISSDLEQVGLYPNPAQNDLNISFSSSVMDEYSIKIIDLTGKLMLLTELNKANINKNSRTIDISSYKPGMYFVEINNGRSKVVKKFLKK
ncbi:T9SS type A sorting domain-containing protein [Flexithrix dorotheae]|uniref:T9SS type A sorting domain-containing protein n=1 Tax=Flexithrix dorotheae TaxID=70993 RepID=UPI00035F58E3|nr:T9SS type A sorting domain-containing protein [Flexithrix dorotheae]